MHLRHTRTKLGILISQALKAEYFQESPMAIDPSMFPTWPAKSEMAAGTNGGAKKAASPKPPSGMPVHDFSYWWPRQNFLCIQPLNFILTFSGGGAFKKINDEDDMDSKMAGFALRGIGLPQPANASWNLKFQICSNPTKT